MQLSEYSIKSIEAVKSGKRLSGVLTSKIPENDREYLCSIFTTDNFLGSIYCLAKNIELPLCIHCGNKTGFESFSKGFRKFCSTSCATKYNNKIHNKQKSQIKSEKYFKSNLDKLIACSQEYINITNTKDISELAKEYGITYSLLRKYLSDNNFIKFGDVKQKRQNKKMQQKYPELFTKEFFEQQQDQKKSSKVVAKELGISSNTLCVYARKFNTPFPSISSTGEYEVKQFFSEFTDVEENSRKIITPYELDIFLPKFNIAVEYNGAFWHSEQNGKNKNYHITKQSLAELSGIKLIQIFDFEWATRKDQITGYFNYLINNNIQSIYARKTAVKNISTEQSKEFLNKNHIQGYINSSLNYGLYYGDELVSVLTLGKSRFTQKYDYEVLRFCNKLGYKVVGGLSKLISHIKKNLKFNKIVSYTHRRLFNGESFLKAGFMLSHKTEPGYFWANQYSHEIISRYKSQKHKLNTTLSESEFMHSKGYVKVWDCGQLVFILENINT